MSTLVSSHLLGEVRGVPLVLLRRACPLHVFFGPVADVRPALGYWGEAVGFREPTDHVPMGPNMRAFADPLGFNRRGPAAHGPHQYTTVYNVINKGVGFKAFSKVGERDARGGSCPTAFAP